MIVKTKFKNLFIVNGKKFKDKRGHFRELLKENKVDVLLDDTEEHLSAKFKKFDLLGIPYQIILGSKSSGEEIEFKEVNEKTETLSLDKVMDKLLKKRNLN